MSTQRVVSALRDVLDYREREHSPVRTDRIVGRNSDGTLQTQRTDAECVITSGADNLYAGQLVQRPPTSPISRQGLTGAAVVREDEETPTLWVERLEPDSFEPGNSYTVIVQGRGFFPELRFDFLYPATGFQPAKTIHDGIHVELQGFVDEQTFELELSVDPDATSVTRAPISFGRQP